MPFHRLIVILTLLCTASTATSATLPKYKAFQIDDTKDQVTSYIQGDLEFKCTPKMMISNQAVQSCKVPFGAMLNGSKRHLQFLFVNNSLKYIHILRGNWDKYFYYHSNDYVNMSKNIQEWDPLNQKYGSCRAKVLNNDDCINSANTYAFNFHFKGYKRPPRAGRFPTHTFKYDLELSDNITLLRELMRTYNKQLKTHQQDEKTKKIKDTF